MSEKILNVSLVITNPDSYSHLWDYRNLYSDSLTKLNIILFHHLKDFLNASLKITFRNSWGYKNESTGTYSGMMGDLQTGISDVGGTSSFISVDRFDVAEFIHVSVQTHTAFIFRAPPLSYIQNLFALPFHSSVWHICLLMCLILIIVIYLITKWEWTNERFQNCNGKSLRPNFIEVIMLQIGSITQQGYDFLPQSYSGGIAYFFSLLVLMFLYNAYSANIVALLQSTSDAVKDLNSLLNTRIDLGVEDIVYSYHYFQNEQEPLRRTIIEKKLDLSKKPNPHFMSIQDGMKRVQKEFFAFHVEVSNGYLVAQNTFQEHEKCGLRQLDFFNLYPPQITIRKNSTYKEAVKIGLKRIQEVGLQAREINRVYSKKPECLNKGGNFKSVGLIDCYAPFLFFGIGVATGTIFLALEMVWKRIINYYYNRQQQKIYRPMNWKAPRNEQQKF